MQAGQMGYVFHIGKFNGHVALLSRRIRGARPGNFPLYCLPYLPDGGKGGVFWLNNDPNLTVQI